MSYFLRLLDSFLRMLQINAARIIAVRMARQQPIPIANRMGLFPSKEVSSFVAHPSTYK